jgi:S-adenosylmethionine decarboxylase proenzyme
MLAGSPMSAPKSRGRHLLLELHGCDAATLADVAAVESALLDAVRAVGATPVHTHLQRFQPQGVSGVIVIAESHLSVHTWPEAGYAAVDLYTCGTGDPLLAREVLAARFGAGDVQCLLVERGLPAPGPSLRLAAD